MVDLAIGVSIAVCEAWKEAGNAAEPDKYAAEDLVRGSATSVVDQKGIEKLEEEDRPCGEDSQVA